MQKGDSSNIEHVCGKEKATGVTVNDETPSNELTKPMGRFSNFEPKSDGSNAGLQPFQLISDSFDAFITAQVNHSQAPKLPSHGSSSSILDAEDTCHAFPFQKFSSSVKDA
ncbi:hypothetical protein GH714_020354 [Hevea brasiliensis]|uniref:Uncharacterized protein n=1 Tax=Hevea brasiliensis TaxID=3981 RepID=A0A6A6K711_HEVBR|nr:hypothetical protein GH714_020354 [Hevea brasiliensis]